MTQRKSAFKKVPLKRAVLLLLFPKMNVPKWNLLFQAEKKNIVLNGPELLSYFS